MAGCWIRTSAVNSGLHQVVGWWFVGNHYGICIYPVCPFTCLWYKKYNYVERVIMLSYQQSFGSFIRKCTHRSGHVLPYLQNNAATILLAKMVQQQQAEYIACNFRQLYNCNKPPSKNIPPKMLSFFAWCVSRFLKDYAIEHTAALKEQKTTNQTVASLGTIFWSSLTFAWLKGQWRQPDPQHFPRFLWATSVNTNNPVAGSV